MTILRTFIYSQGNLYLTHPGDQPLASEAFRKLLTRLAQENSATFQRVTTAPFLAVEVTSTHSLAIQGVAECRLNETSIQKFLQPSVPAPQSEPSIQSSFSFFSLLKAFFLAILLLFAFKAAAASLPLNAPKGISNEGNTCFINATFQMIMNSPELKKALVETFQPTPSSDPYFSVYQTFLRAVAAYEHGGSVTLQGLRGLMAGSIYSQEDASELIHILLNRVELAHYSLGCKQGFEREWIRCNTDDVNEAAILAERDDIPPNHHTLRIEEKPDLILRNHRSFKEGDTGQKLMDEMVSFQSIGGERYAFRQGYFMPARERTVLEPAPQRFIFELKRFDWKNRTKITQEIPMPQIMTIGPNRYQLQSIVVHSGSMSGGHYWAFVNKARTWFKADDSQVTENPSDLEHALCEGYLYFYEQVT